MISDLEGVGFEKYLDLDHAEHRLQIFKNLNGTGVFDASDGLGTRVICLGTFFYKGSCGNDALKLWLTQGTRSSDGVHGHHLLILLSKESISISGDPFCAQKVYLDDAKSCISNSFLCVAAATPSLTLDPTSCYQYVWNQALFGQETFFKEISSLGADKDLCLAGRTWTEKTSCVALKPIGKIHYTSLEEAAEHQLEALGAVFRAYNASAKSKIRSALSGGFDSRLLLALLLKYECDPELYVYGKPDNPDVKVALAVSQSLGVDVEHIQKQAPPALTPDEAQSAFTRDFLAFDGWKYTGNFALGSDFADRHTRVNDGRYLMNGSLGEIYRNFFYLPNHSLSLRKHLHGFYFRIAKTFMTDRFDAEEFESRLICQFKGALGTDDEKVERSQIDWLYPAVRGRYWTARDVSTNLRFGNVAYPFLEASVVESASAIPTSMKEYGQIESAMIRILSKEVAGVPSVYGFNFLEVKPPLKYRFKTQLNNHRPFAIRKQSYQLKQRISGTPNAVDTLTARLKFVDPRMPRMSELFRLDRVTDPNVADRICALELMCQKLNVTK